MNAHAGVTGLSVEDGLVDFEGAGRRVVVGSLQHVETDSKGEDLDPKAVMLSEIARWRFKQDDLPVGTVLFKDDFEKDLSKWTVINGEVKIVDGGGVGGGRCLRAHWTNPEGMLMVPKIAMRYRDYELVSNVRTTTARNGRILSEMTGQIEPYSAIRIGWYKAATGNVVDVDDLVIRTIEAKSAK